MGNGNGEGGGLLLRRWNGDWGWMGRVKEGRGGRAVKGRDPQGLVDTTMFQILENTLATNVVTVECFFDCDSVKKCVCICSVKIKLY